MSHGKMPKPKTRLRKGKAMEYHEYKAKGNEKVEVTFTPEEWKEYKALKEAGKKQWGGMEGKTIIQVNSENEDPYELAKKIEQRLSFLPKKPALSTAEEIYDEAIFQRASNSVDKLRRLTQELLGDVENAKRFAENIYRAKLEVEVLLAEIDEKKAKVLASAKNSFNFAEDQSNPYDRLRDLEEKLKYVGTDLLDTYVLLRTVFDIDNERTNGMQHGSKSIKNMPAGGSGDFCVDFQTPYPEGVTPVVTMAVVTKPVAGCVLTVTERSNTGFKFTAKNISTRTIEKANVSWMAVQS